MTLDQEATTMKTLIVMRHGKAMPCAPSQQDMDRSLTKAGTMALKARLPHMLRLLEIQGRRTQIWASPAKRACQTAELLERALKDRGDILVGKTKKLDRLWE